MNSGIENLIGSVSYELASNEACQTKAQHEAGPSPSKLARHKRTSQGCARPTARQAQRAPKVAAVVGSVVIGLRCSGCARAHGAPRGLLCVRVCLCSHTKPKAYRIRLMIKFLILKDKLIKYRKEMKRKFIDENGEGVDL